MKQVTNNILGILNDESFLNQLDSTVNSNPSVVHGDVNLGDAYTNFQGLILQMKKLIETGQFDDISYNRRNSIFNALHSLRQNVGNPQNTVSQLETLNDQATIAGIYLMGSGKKNIQSELSDLATLKQRYTKHVNAFQSSRKSLDFINTKKKELEGLLETATNSLKRLDEIKDQMDAKVPSIDQTINLIGTKQQEANQKVQEIEGNKVSVKAFSTNIEEYKSSIEELKLKCEEIIDKEEEINELISQAENALQLKSAEGVSAAFSARFDAASKWQIYTAWLASAVILMLLALAGTAWILLGWGLDNADPIAAVIGRVVAVGITITGATFCANQYVKQKNLAEDYAYKATLSKSIVAFSEEIQKSDQTQIAKYLTKVLDEIHQDPLRSRGKKDKELEPTKEVLEKILDYIKMAKS